MIIKRKTFARRDYAGLDSEAAAKLKEIRSQEARSLLRQRKNIQEAAAGQRKTVQTASEFLKAHPYDPAKYKGTFYAGQFASDFGKLGKGEKKMVETVQNIGTGGANKLISQEIGNKYTTLQGASRNSMEAARKDLLMETKKRAQASAPKISKPAYTKPSTGTAPGAFGRHIGSIFKGTSKYGRPGQIAAIGTAALLGTAIGSGIYEGSKRRKENKAESRKDYTI